MTSVSHPRFSPISPLPDSTYKGFSLRRLQIHLRTTNPVESPFAAGRLRTDAAKRYKKVANAEALIWKMLMIAEKKFRRLNSPELLAAVYDGQLFEDGMSVNETAPKRRAA